MSKKFPLSGLGLQIKAHWKAHRPQMYRQLEEAGELDRSVYEAQRRTEEAFADQVEAGLPAGQAWEAVREEWAFLPAEPEPPDVLEDEGLALGASLFEDEAPNSEGGVAPPRVDTAAGSPTPSPMSAPPSIPRSAHPALLLLADLDGQLKPEFRDWDNDLLLEEGSLVPKWFPWEFEGQELISPEDREEQFRLNLDALLNVASRVTGRAPPTSPQRVLDCLIQLRSMFVSQ